MIAEGTPRKSKQSFKHEITLIAQCVNIEIQYMAGWGKNTLINDVWCGFTNYIFQAFKRETRLIAEESFLNAGKSADFCFLITIAAPLINYVNWMEASRTGCLLKIPSLGENILFLCFHFSSLRSPPASASTSTFRWKSSQVKNFGSCLWCEVEISQFIIQMGWDLLRIYCWHLPNTSASEREKLSLHAPSWVKFYLVKV